MVTWTQENDDEYRLCIHLGEQRFDITYATEAELCQAMDVFILLRLKASADGIRNPDAVRQCVADVIGEIAKRAEGKVV